MWLLLFIYFDSPQQLYFQVKRKEWMINLNHSATTSSHACYCFFLFFPVCFFHLSNLTSKSRERSERSNSNTWRTSSSDWTKRSLRPLTSRSCWVSSSTTCRYSLLDCSSSTNGRAFWAVRTMLVCLCLCLRVCVCGWGRERERESVCVSVLGF